MQDSPKNVDDVVIELLMGFSEALEGWELHMNWE
jgi:hypothetical protein